METTKGLKRIEDFEGKESIYSHKGVDEVRRGTSNLWKGKFLQLDGRTIEQSIICTDSHEFLVKERNGSVDWKAAKAIDCTKDRLLTRIEDKPSANSYFYQGKRQLVDKSFCELSGIFASRGSVRGEEIQFLIYPGERAITQKIIGLMRTKFGFLKKNTIFSKNGQIFLTYQSKEVSLLLSDLTGAKNGRADNRVPECVLGARSSDQLYFIRGWLEGEKGFICENDKCCLKGSSSSYNFIREMKMMGIWNGIIPTVKIREKEGFYRIDFSLSGRLGMIFYNSILLNSEIIIPKELKKEIVEFEGELFIAGGRIDICQVDAEEQKVYCLEVPENSSFTVGGQVTHNCRAFSKTFISILAMYLICMFRPGSKVFICAPKKERMIAPSYSNIG